MIVSFLCLLLIPIFKFIINFSKFKRIEALHKLYLSYIEFGKKDIILHKHEVKKMFYDAGLKDAIVYDSKHLVFNHFANHQVSVFDNLTSTREDVVLIINLRFNEAKGVFKMRFSDSWNIVYWIELLINLPKEVFSYLGLNTESKLVKVLKLLYWTSAATWGFKKVQNIDQVFKYFVEILNLEL